MQQLIGRFRGKALRYLTVSLVATISTQVLLWLFVHAGWEGAYANVVAVGATCVPAFFVNRAWVWGKFGDHSMGREFAPFWLMTLAGLVLSTVFVVIVDRLTDVSWALNLASIAGFAALWVVKFVVLDEYLFSHTPQGESHEPARSGSGSTTDHHEGRPQTTRL
jgi:putative flippase GtrA